MKPAHLIYLLALIKLILPFFLQTLPGKCTAMNSSTLRRRVISPGAIWKCPLLSVFAWLTNLPGGAMWAIKIWPSLAGALTYVLVGRLVLHLGGR